MTDTPMSNLESSIRDLVSAHEAFWTCKMTPVERRSQSDWNALREWATILRNAQSYLGIVIVDDAIIAANLDECEDAKAADKRQIKPTEPF